MGEVLSIPLACNPYVLQEDGEGYGAPVEVAYCDNVLLVFHTIKMASVALVSKMAQLKIRHERVKDLLIGEASKGLSKTSLMMEYLIKLDL